MKAEYERTFDKSTFRLQALRHCPQPHIALQPQSAFKRKHNGLVAYAEPFSDVLVWKVSWTSEVFFMRVPALL
jgi:hypothetical protein